MNTLSPCPHCWGGALPAFGELMLRCPVCGGHGTLRTRYDIRVVPQTVLDGYRASIYERTDVYGIAVWMGLFETEQAAITEAARQRVILEGTGERL